MVRVAYLVHVVCMGCCRVAVCCTACSALGPNSSPPLLAADGQLRLRALVCVVLPSAPSHSYPFVPGSLSIRELSQANFLWIRPHFGPDQQIVVVAKCSMNVNAIQSVRLYATACNCKFVATLSPLFRTQRPRLDPVWLHLADENSFRSAHTGRSYVGAWC